MSSPLRLPQLNDVRLIGRLTRDPELRYTAKGTAVCRFDLAVNRRYRDQASGEWKDDTSFIPVVVWRETGQRVGERLHKGSPVLVEGRLRSRNWETKEGQKRTTIEVDSQRVQILEKSESGPSDDGEDAAPVAVPAGPSADTGHDDDVPF